MKRPSSHALPTTSILALLRRVNLVAWAYDFSIVPVNQLQSRNARELAQIASNQNAAVHKRGRRNQCVQGTDRFTRALELIWPEATQQMLPGAGLAVC